MGGAGAAAIRSSCRLSRRRREIVGSGPALSKFRKPGRDRKTGRAARGERPLAARPRRRAALSGGGEAARRRPARAIASIGCALCAAARYGGGLRKRGRSHLDRARRRSRRRNRRGGRAAAGLGRRHSRAPGDADQLSPFGGDRRCPAGRDRGGARPGPVLVDQRASAAASAARPAAAGLPPPPPWCSTAPGTNSRNRPPPPACGNSAPEARPPADIRRLVGLG